MSRSIGCHPARKIGSAPKGSLLGCLLGLTMSSEALGEAVGGACELNDLPVFETINGLEDYALADAVGRSNHSLIELRGVMSANWDTATVESFYRNNRGARVFFRYRSGIGCTTYDSILYCNRDVRSPYTDNIQSIRVVFRGQPSCTLIVSFSVSNLPSL